MHYLWGAVLLLIAIIAGFLWVNKSSSAGARETKAPAPVVNSEKQQRKQDVTIVYGSQTGTAERFAGELKDALLGKFGGGRAYNVVDVEDYGHEEDLGRESLIFLVMATYGEGEPTETASAFVSWLTELGKTSTEGKPLKGVRYGVFGLGNRQYKDFCVVGGRVHELMEACGAQPVVQNGEGDDDANIQADFDQWKQRLLKALDGNSLL